MDVLSLLSADSYVVVNKTLAKLYGNDAAILLGYFASLQKFNQGEFYRTFKKIESDINIKEAQARKIINTCMEDSLLFKESRGLPRKVFYRLNEEVLLNILLNLPKSTVFRTSQEEVLELCRTRYKNSVLRGSLYKDKNTEKNNTKENLKENFPFNLFSNEWVNNENFHTLILEYIAHRKEKNAGMSHVGWKRLATKLQKYSLNDACEALEISIEKGWTGVFPESLKQNNTQTKLKSGAPSHLEQDFDKYTKFTKYGKTAKIM